MDRRRLLAACALTLAAASAAGAVAWSAMPAAGRAASQGVDRTTGQDSDVGIAGPLGPQAIVAVPSYFKRVTFGADQLGQAQLISARLPAGRYLVEVITPKTPVGRSPDCLGVSFPLVPPVRDGAGFQGYVSVAKDGDAASVSCYERARDGTSTVTYELFYVPAMLAAPGPRIGERS